MTRVPALVSIAAMALLGALRRGFGLIGMAVLTRLLTPSEVGAYAFAQSAGQTFVGLMRLGALQGLHVALSRRSEDDRAEIGDLIGGGLTLVAGIALVGCVGMLALADPIAHRLFGAPELAPVMAAAAVFFAGQFLSRGVYVVYAGLDQFVAYTRWATWVGAATLGTTVAGAVLVGVEGAIWGLALGTLAGVPILAVGLDPVLRQARLRPRICLRRDHLRQIFSIGLPFYGAGIFMVPAVFASQGAVSRFGGVSDLADLRIILALMALVQLVPQAVSGPVISLLSRREGGQAGAGRAAAFVHMKWLWIVALMGCSVLAGAWPVAVTLFFGPGYPNAVLLGPLALVCFIPTIVGTALSAGLLVGGRTRPMLAVGFVEGAIMAGMAFVLVPRAGLAGFLVAQGAASTAALLAWLAVLAAQTGTTPWRRWMGPLGAGTLLFGGTVVLHLNSAAQGGPEGQALLWLPLVMGVLSICALAEDERCWLRARIRMVVARLRRRGGVIS
ncbi:MAG: lipopolysaccharide biosynthesis protein [Pseudomonadota bacterium]